MTDLYLLKRMSLDRNVVAATSLLHEIYVITEDCDTVLVYYCHRPYKLKTRVSIPNMHPTDLATSYADVCVYLLDSYHLCIWRIHRQSKTTTKYPLHVSVDEVLKSMSITKKGLIVVVLGENKILMYNPVDREMKRIFLEGVSSSEDGIAHATEIGDSRLLACHDTQTFVYDLERAEVNKAMDVGGNHITLKDSKCAIITDNTGQRLQTLDVEKWEITKVIVERNGQRSPGRVHYAMENGLLFVTWQNCLYVYSFERTDVESYLADTDTDTRQEDKPEAASSAGTTFTSQLTLLYSRHMNSHIPANIVEIGRQEVAKHVRGIHHEKG